MEKAHYVVNPTIVEQPLSAMDLLVSSTKDKVVWLKSGKQLPESVIVEGIKLAKVENKKLLSLSRNRAKLV